MTSFSFSHGTFWYVHTHTTLCSKDAQEWTLKHLLRLNMVRHVILQAGLSCRLNSPSFYELSSKFSYSCSRYLLWGIKETQCYKKRSEIIKITFQKMTSLSGLLWRIKVLYNSRYVVILRVEILWKGWQPVIRPLKSVKKSAVCSRNNIGISWMVQQLECFSDISMGED